MAKKRKKNSAVGAETPSASDGEPRKLSRKEFESELYKLQVELCRLQEWTKHAGLRIVVVFEGRDAAGKGGAIKRIIQCLNPRVCRVEALGIALALLGVGQFGQRRRRTTRVGSARSD